MKKALVIDGNSLFYRIYYATIAQVDFALKNNWTPNNAIKMMINFALKYINDKQYDYFLIAFDHQDKTFRHQELPSYKENRKAAPDDLYIQMNDTIDCLKALGITVLQKSSIEADDLIGSFVYLMNQNNVFVDVISADKDMLQLVDRLCDILLIKKGLSDLDVHNIHNFSDKYYGLCPKQVIEYKAIVGDSSDGLKGVEGIGNKTGIELLKKYHNLDNIFSNLDNLTFSQKQKFENSKAYAYQCQRLATILKDQLLDFSITDFELKEKNYEILKTTANKYKLKNLDEFIFLHFSNKLFDL